MKGKKFLKNQKVLLLILPLFAVVAISGCTGTGTTGPTFGNGLTVLNWEPTSSSLESGDNLQLRLRIQNQGELTAQDVNAVITGIVPDEWGITMSQASFGDMAPPNRVQQTAGEIKQEMFDATAPNLPKGTSQQYTANVRVFYTYRTTASKLVTVVNDEELKRLQDQGKTLSSQDTVSSAGPLKVTINTGKFLKTKDTGISFSRTFPITIDIQNTGGGVVSTQGNPDNDYKVRFAVEIPSRLDIDCANSGSFLSNVITLWKGQTATITCNVRINTPPVSSEDDNIKAVLDYDYYTDSSTTIAVTGTQEGTGPFY